MARIRTSIGGVYPSRTWLSALETFGYLQQAPVIDYFSNLGGGNLNYPAGYYLANDPMLRTQYITNVTSLPITLARYSTNTGNFPVARTLMKAMAYPPYTPGLEATDVLEKMATTLLSHPDPGVRMHAVEQMARYVPDLFLEILTNYGITLNGPSDSAYAMGILYSQAAGNPMLYKAKLLNLYITNPALVEPWLQQATGDSLYLDGSGWSVTTGYETMLRDALNAFGDDAANEEAMASSMAKDAVGMYGAVSWWPGSMEQVTYWSGGSLADIAYYSDPVNYITSLTSIRGAAFLDTALSLVADYDLDLPTLASDVSVVLSTVQLANLAGNPYLKDQSIYLSNHHIYGSSRVGISQYLSGQYKYRYNYEYGLVDTFGMTAPRPWYSFELNSPVKAGEVSPYGNPMDSIALAEHVLGQKQYEMVNHLSNVQEVITDKKYWKDENSDGNRDVAKAVVQSVYDYYPFGQLMAGRSILDTIGMCVTRTSYQEIPNYKWVPSAGMSIGGNVSSEGSTSLTASSSGGVNVSGTGGGIRYEIYGITSHSIQLKTFFSMLSGTATITIWQGTTVGMGGTQLGSTTSSFTSPAPVIMTSVGGTTTSPKTITVVVSMGTGSSRPLFGVDSISYSSFWWTLATGLYTTCGEPKDHYEFGYNGQMKSNEIAGMGNHYEFGYREFDPRLGRFWSVDPLRLSYPWNSTYAFAENDVIRAIDLEGLEKYVVRRYYKPNGELAQIRIDFCRNGANELVDLQMRRRDGHGRRLTHKNVIVFDMHGNDKEGFKVSWSTKDQLSEAEQKIADRVPIHCPNESTHKKQIYNLGIEDKRFQALWKEKWSHYMYRHPVVNLENFAFNTNSDHVIGNNERIFKNIVKYLDDNPESSLLVTGTTDKRLNDRGPITIGDANTIDGTMKDVADARALKIISTLISEYGVDPERLETGTSERIPDTDVSATVEAIPRKNGGAQSSQSQNDDD